MPDVNVQAVTHTGAEMESRYYLDGKRVSFETYDRLRNAAFMFGTMDCFQTKAWPIGTRTRRANYSIIRVPQHTYMEIMQE